VIFTNFGSSPVMSVCGSIPLSTSENTAEMVVLVSWLFGNLVILPDDRDTILFTP